MEYLGILMAGFAGGATRGLVGFVKHQYSYRDAGFNLLHFVGMTIISGAIGLFVAVSVEQTQVTFLGGGGLTPAIAFIIAYAGGDFIENIAKIIYRKGDKE